MVFVHKSRHDEFFLKYLFQLKKIITLFHKFFFIHKVYLFKNFSFFILTKKVLSEKPFSSKCFFYYFILFCYNKGVSYFLLFILSATICFRFSSFLRRPRFSFIAFILHFFLFLQSTFQLNKFFAKIK